MNQLSIDILKFVSQMEKNTNSDVIREHFKSNTKNDVIEAIKSLCGSTASNGYIICHKTSRSDYPDIDNISITPSGHKLLSSY